MLAPGPLWRRLYWIVRHLASQLHRRPKGSQGQQSKYLGSGRVGGLGPRFEEGKNLKKPELQGSLFKELPLPRAGRAQSSSRVSCELPTRATTDKWNHWTILTIALVKKEKDRSQISQMFFWHDYITTWKNTSRKMEGRTKATYHVLLTHSFE